MASADKAIYYTLGLFTAGYGLAEIAMPKHEKSEVNSTHSAIAAILGILASGVTYGFTKNMETSMLVGSFMVGVAANRGMKWLSRVH